MTMEVVVSKFASQRCAYCEREWPPGEGYTECPACREPTTGQLFRKPSIDPSEAAVLAAWYAFGWWLWDHGRL